MKTLDQRSTSWYDLPSRLAFCFPPLQHYIQHALIAPREREAKRAAAAATMVPVQGETVVEANGTTSASSSETKGFNPMGKYPHLGQGYVFYTNLIVYSHSATNYPMMGG